LVAGFNSAFRAIDLTSQIIAPILVGVIQDQVSKLASAVTIAVWNLISMFIE
jgi:iron-regulated transporter 1